jgi:hypothetical protein
MEEATVERVTAEEYRAQTEAARKANEEKADDKAEAASDASADGKKVTNTELGKMKVSELRQKADELGIDFDGLKKPELVDALYEELSK